MTLLVDVKDVHIHVLLVKILQLNVCHVIQYPSGHYKLNHVFVMVVILILEHLFALNAHKHVLRAYHKTIIVNLVTIH